ncbi:hypothetical protein DERP_007316 [Dermatophagoides pteronyssinus]|uniref:Uncharacterized protein n=1 Tax=Dermatophagoides pteronyssinus TaxID=6956 RepID=A0ABQ8J421_DERPT|nr:hypothetical protein DERP_007316 [Dermatophagoides pteronyssinus]
MARLIISSYFIIITIIISGPLGQNEDDDHLTILYIIKAVSPFVQYGIDGGGRMLDLIVLKHFS